MSTPRPGRWHAPTFAVEILRFLVVVFFAEVGGIMFEVMRVEPKKR